MKDKWYKTTWGIILMLVLFFPVGVVLMWRFSGWNQNLKIIVTCVTSLVLLYILGNIQIAIDSLKA